MSNGFRCFPRPRNTVPSTWHFISFAYVDLFDSCWYFWLQPSKFFNFWLEYKNFQSIVQKGWSNQVLSNPLFRAYKKLEIFKADFRRTIWQFCRKSYWSQIENGGVHDVILCSHKPTTLVSHGALITGPPLFLGSIENMTLFANEQMS